MPTIKLERPNPRTTKVEKSPWLKKIMGPPGTGKTYRLSKSLFKKRIK